MTSDSRPTILWTFTMNPTSNNIVKVAIFVNIERKLYFLQTDIKLSFHAYSRSVYLCVFVCAWTHVEEFVFFYSDITLLQFYHFLQIASSKFSILFDHFWHKRNSCKRIIRPKLLHNITNSSSSYFLRFWKGIISGETECYHHRQQINTDNSIVNCMTFCSLYRHRKLKNVY